MRRPATFDDRLEALCADATPDQLQRMQDLAALLLRMAAKRHITTTNAKGSGETAGPVATVPAGGQTRRRQSARNNSEIPPAPCPGPLESKDLEAPIQA